MTTIAAGMTVRITRVQPNGKVKFVKTGTVGATVRPDYFEFTEDIDSSEPGRRVFVTSDTALPAGMRGWTQRTEIVAG
ncbi:hypothetical protein AQJ23_45185 [Streptomyces antibioticus]|nr:hypothetical protein [Streptomyces antibioticus]KUN16473.1 hypothetical protein AQJ23_45185 [Streptomyces antibioticus]